MIYYLHNKEKNNCCEFRLKSHINKLRCVEQVSMATNNQIVSSNNNISRSSNQVYIKTSIKARTAR